MSSQQSSSSADRFVGVFISGHYSSDYAALIWAKNFVTKLPNEGQYKLRTIRSLEAKSIIPTSSSMQTIQETEEPSFKTQSDVQGIKDMMAKVHDLKDIPSKLLLYNGPPDVATASRLPLDTLIVGYEATAMGEAATREGLEYIAKLSGCTIVLLADPTTPNDPNPNHPVNYVDVSITPADYKKYDLRALSWGWAYNNNDAIKLPEGFSLCTILTRQGRQAQDSNFEIDFQKQGIFSSIRSRLPVKSTWGGVPGSDANSEGLQEYWKTVETQLAVLPPASAGCSVVVLSKKEDNPEHKIDIVSANGTTGQVSAAPSGTQKKYVGVFISGVSSADSVALRWAKEFVSELPNKDYELCTIRIQKAEMIAPQVQLTEDPLFKAEDNNVKRIKKANEELGLKIIPSKLLLAVHDDGISNDDYLVETLELAIKGLPLDTLIVGYKAEAAEREWLQNIDNLSAGCSIVLAAEHATRPPAVVDKYVGVFIPRDLSDNIKNDLTALSWVIDHRIQLPAKDGYKFCPIFIRQQASGEPQQVNRGKMKRFGDIEQQMRAHNTAIAEIDSFQDLAKDFVNNTHAIWYEGGDSIDAITKKVVGDDDLQPKFNTIITVGRGWSMGSWETIKTRLAAGCSVVLVKKEEDGNTGGGGATHSTLGGAASSPPPPAAAP